MATPNRPSATILERREVKALVRLLEVPNLTVLERRVLTLRVRDGRSWGLICGALKLTEPEVRAIIECAKGKAKAASETGRSTVDKFNPFHGDQLKYVPAGRGPRPLPPEDENPFKQGATK